MTNINIFNAIKTIKEIVGENEKISLKLNEIEIEINTISNQIDEIKKETAIFEAVTEMEWLKKQESAKNDIIKYIIDHGNKNIRIPIRTWNNWKIILSGFIKIEEKFYDDEKTTAEISYYDILNTISCFYK